MDYFILISTPVSVLNSDCLGYLPKVSKKPSCLQPPYLSSLSQNNTENCLSFLSPGLAQTAVHGPSSSPVIPSSWFDESETTGLISRFTSALGLADKGSHHQPDIHAFTILARVIADPALAPPLQSGSSEEEEEEAEFYRETVKTYGDHIVKYVNEWNLDGDLLDKKVEELLWTNVLIYAVGGSEEEGNFNADFFQYVPNFCFFIPIQIFSNRCKRT